LIGLLAAVAILLTGSRGALVGVGIAAIAALLLSLWLPDLRSRLSSRRARIAVGVVVGAAVLATPLLATRFAQGGDALRIDLWRSALTLFANHPLTGTGPGTWAQLKLAANPAGAANLVLPHVHDLYLQVLSEEGIAGLVALLILGFCVARRLLQAMRSSDSSLRAESLAVTLGLVAVGGQCLTDNVTNLPAVCLLLVAVVAWVDGRLTALQEEARLVSSPTDSTQPAPRRLARGVAAAALVGLVITIPVTAVLDRAALAARDGNAAAATGAWRSAAASYRDAANADPGMALYRLELAVALARTGDLAGARSLYADVVKSDALPLNLVSLAVLDQEAGDCVAAAEHATEAMKGTSGDAGVALNAAAVAERCGDQSRALDWYGQALAAAPQLAADPYWDDPERMASRDAVVDAADARLIAAGDNASRVLLYAARGDATIAGQELASLTTPCPSCAAAVAWAAGDTDASIDGLEQQMAAHPLDYVSAVTLARELWLAGRNDDAVRYARWAEIVEGDSAPSLESAPNAIAIDAPGALLQPAAYPVAVYQRDGPVSIWVPGMLTPVFHR
jgi:tetratricopeptide (TPR) repeat protein